MERAAPYACADADMTLRLANQLQPELEDKALWALFSEVEMPLVDTLAAIERNGVLVDPDELDRAIESLTEASTHVGAKMASGDYADAVAGATPFTRMWGTAVGGAFLAKSVLASQALIDAGTDDDTLRAKQSVARFYCEQILPTANGLLGSVLAPAEPLFELPNEALTV